MRSLTLLLCFCRMALRVKDRVKPNRRVLGSSDSGTPSTTSILSVLSFTQPKSVCVSTSSFCPYRPGELSMRVCVFFSICRFFPLLYLLCIFLCISEARMPLSVAVYKLTLYTKSHLQLMLLDYSILDQNNTRESIKWLLCLLGLTTRNRHKWKCCSSSSSLFLGAFLSAEQLPPRAADCVAACDRSSCVETFSPVTLARRSWNVQGGFLMFHLFRDNTGLWCVVCTDFTHLWVQRPLFSTTQFNFCWLVRILTGSSLPRPKGLVTWPVEQGTGISQSATQSD